MNDLKLSEAQSRYFGDLFLCCCDKNETSDQVSYDQATELFRSANLSADLVRQILRIAQIADGVTQISRRQFYSCLKLISACQAGFSPAALSQETLHEDVSPMALPRFSWFGANDVNRTDHSMSSSTTSTLNNGSVANGYMTQDLIELSQGGSSANRSGASTAGPSSLIKAGATSTVVEHPCSTDSEVEQNDDSSAIENSDNHHNRHGNGSPSAWSTGSESPTPTNSVAVNKSNHLWQGLLCEEQRQLLGTEEESSDRHSSDDDPANDPHSHSQRHSPDPELLYTISEDQRMYYTKQYQSVQRDALGNVSGPVARVFFEKSRIPVEELRHVWKLCDVTKDGALSQEEFMAAMHLVVLRRNNIPLPMKLPRCLNANNILRHTISPPPAAMQEADLLHLNDDAKEDQGKVVDTDECDNGGESSMLDCGPESINSVAEDQHHHLNNNQQRSTNSNNNNKAPPVAARTVPPPPIPAAEPSSGGDWNMSQPASNWTKFNESPTTTNNNKNNNNHKTNASTTATVSSPGPKPVHFDIQWTVQAVGADPQILHPVALRLTPQGAEAVTNNNNNTVNNGSVGVAIVSKDNRESSTSPNNNNNNKQTNVEFRPIQRPQAKKVKQHLGGVGALPPPPSQNMMNMSIDSAALLSSRGEDQQSSSPDEDYAEDQTTPPSLSGSGNHPPIPPPRLPITRHTRSSSLDLNKLLLQSNAAVPQSVSSALLPEVPPRESHHQHHLQAVQPQLSCDSKLESTFADFSQFSEAAPKHQPAQSQQQSSKTTTHKPTIPSKRTSAFEVYRKPIPRQAESPPGILDQEKKCAHLEEMMRSLNLNSGNNRAVGGVVLGQPSSTVQQLKDQNAVLVNLCLELGNELFAMRYKREEMAQRLQQVDVVRAIAEEGSVSGGGGGVSTASGKI